MDFSKTYYLRKSLKRKVLELYRCSHLKQSYEIYGGIVIPETPVTFFDAKKGKPDNYLDVTPPFKVFSQTLIDFLRDQAFSGWTTFPVEVHGKKNEKIEGYQGFAVTGRCGLIDDSQSEEIWVPNITGSTLLQMWKGLYFDPASWDGSDFFLPFPNCSTFVTERVKNAFEKHKIRNFEFVPLTEYQRFPSQLKR